MQRIPSSSIVCRICIQPQMPVKSWNERASHAYEVTRSLCVDSRKAPRHVWLAQRWLLTFRPRFFPELSKGWIESHALYQAVMLFANTSTPFNSWCECTQLLGHVYLEVCWGAARKRKTLNFLVPATNKSFWSQQFHCSDSGLSDGTSSARRRLRQ